MTALLLGPLLRHVDATSATIWVETDGPCEVGADATARTFEVSGHHYALVVLTGLEPAKSTPYEVRLDGDVVWPEPGGDLPPSRIRTLSPEDSRFRLVFGSCRKPREQDALGQDALAAYARRMAKLAEEEWPESLVLLGDQVYADETTDDTQKWLASRRDTSQPPGSEVADFEEYCHLYSEAWSDPAVRWLLSTLPTSMIFDDHDVRDDWNTSQAWRAEMAATSWWPERIRGALVSYWIYQHLGNLGPEELMRRQALPAGRHVRHGQRGAAARVRRPRRPGGRRRQGHALVLPARLRPGPAARDRLAGRAHPRRRRAVDDRRGRVPLDRGAGRRATSTTC